MNTLSVTSHKISNPLSSILAVVEVVAVRIILWLILGSALLDPLRDWQTNHLLNNFTTHFSLLIVPLLLLLATHRRLADYGISVAHWRQDITSALTVFLLFAIAGGALGFLPFTLWYGALGASALYIAILFLAAKQLDGKPNSKSGFLTIGLAVLMFGGYGITQGLFPGFGQALSNLVFYGIFVGFGEELFYRGYAQSRLNMAFGRPYTFLGVQIGWGWILAALIFGLSHYGGGPWYILWTTFSGLAFGYIYERTRSIIAPGILHGLPQALFVTFIAWGS